jgi:hypothetical protein
VFAHFIFSSLFFDLGSFLCLWLTSFCQISGFALWDFESQDFGQVSLKAGESVIIQDEQADGWSTVEKKGGETGFVPSAFLDKSKQKRKGTLFGKKKGSSEPPPPIPPFGSSAKKEEKGAATGKRRFATNRRAGASGATPTTLADLGARYGGEEETVTPREEKEKETPAEEPKPEPVAELEKPVETATSSPALARSSGGGGVAPKDPPAASGGPGVVHSPGGTRKKVGKLNNMWAAKVDGGVKTTGPKKVVVKNYRITKNPKNLGSSMPGGLNQNLVSPKGRPSAPPPELKQEKLSSPRRNSENLSASTPSLKADMARPTASTVRMAESPVKVSTETLEELAKMNDRRTNIMREMYETEKSYVRNLKEICDLYMGPMKDTKWKDHINKLFSNIMMIVQINDELLEGLSKAISDWNPETTQVGPVFAKMAPFMRLYNTYGNSYNDAATLLLELKKKDDFSTFLQNCRGTQPLDLEALLIQPVQRIPRYRMLLEDMLKNTPSSHPDKAGVETSLIQIRDVANNVNESIRATEQAKKIGEQTGLQKYIAPHRKLLAEQTFLAKVAIIRGDKVKGSVDVNVFLFNDLLVFFFAKQIKLKDNRRHDFVELAWPHTLMWVKLDGKTSFKITGPSLIITLTSKEKDSTSGASQIAGFHQRLVDVCNTELPESTAAAKAPAVRTAGTNFGQFDYPEGMKYVGEWRDGLPQGKGTLMYVGGLKVVGSFDEGYKHGECVITFPTGEIYTGSCMKGDQHGIGEIVWPNGDTYKGYWLGGRRDGEGTFTCAHYKYEGSWSDGLMDGEGKLSFNGGGWYEGKFKEGKFNGDGYLVRGNGIRTKGTWVQGVLEGEAEEFYPESMALKSYQGVFRNNKREGGGTMFYRDGSQYKGEWKDNLRHGRGILTCPSRPIMRYEGNWVADQFEGKGEVFFSTKDRYVGSFSSGWMHGPGVYYYANGVQVAGEWKQGNRQRKVQLTRGEGNERFDVEITGAKDHIELGDAKYNGKLLHYMLPPARPDLDSSMLEQESVAEQESNFITGKVNVKNNLIPDEEAPPDSPSMSGKKDRPRSTTGFLGALKRKESKK